MTDKVARPIPIHARFEKELKPFAELIRDLNIRGMLDDTPVVWTTEFGRTPDHKDLEYPRREHHHQVFCSWRAGARVKPGVIYGASIEYGIYVAENRVHVHDFHATILHLLGLDHERLTYQPSGRNYRQTAVHSKVIEGLRL